MLKIKVVFQHQYDRDTWGSKKYNYLTDIGDLGEGDLLVVETQHGYAVAKFIRYVNELEVNASSWVIQKIDIDSFNAKKEHLKQIKEIQLQIEERAKQANKRKFYEELAKSDPELKTLLDTLDSLQK